MQGPFDALNATYTSDTLLASGLSVLFQEGDMTTLSLTATSTAGSDISFAWYDGGWGAFDVPVGATDLEVLRISSIASSNRYNMTLAPQAAIAAGASVSFVHALLCHTALPSS